MPSYLTMGTHMSHQTAAILDRLRTEAQSAKNGKQPILARSFDLAIGEIEHLLAALRKIDERTTDPVARSIAAEAVVIHEQRAATTETK